MLKYVGVAHMAFEPGHEPIDDEELIYRRIPVSKGWYSSEGGLSAEAFDPRKDESTGISVSRGKYKSVDQAARGLSKQGYYIAVFKAGDLRAAGIRIEPRPVTDDPGHAELPDLTCNNRNTDEALSRKSLLTSLCLEIHGPFVPTSN